VGDAAIDPRLWDALRARRRALADAQNVPTYVIFHDATLAEIARRKPKTLDAFLEIPGIGDRKLARYGDAFMQVVAEFA
jgi:ATP-dependent DNA helicase RecQ